MDFSQFNVAGNMEKGAFCQLGHLVTGEPLHEPEDPEKKVGFIVRGSNSTEVAKMRREAEAATIAAGKRANMPQDADGIAPEGGELLPDQDSEPVEDKQLAKDLADAAMPFIVRAVNIEVPRDYDDPTSERVPVGADRELIYELLVRATPWVGPEKDEDGNIVRDDNGDPKLTIVNRPFSLQVIDFAADQSNYLGKS